MNQPMFKVCWPMRMQSLVRKCRVTMETFFEVKVSSAQSAEVPKSAIMQTLVIMPEIPQECFL